MRLTEKWTSFFGRTTYSKREGVTEQDVIDKLGKIEDECLCECPQGMVKVDFTPGTTIYVISKIYDLLWSSPYNFKIYKKEATLKDCLECTEQKAFGKTYFTSKDRCWEEFKRLSEKEWKL